MRMHCCAQVRAVRLRRDRIVVALEHKVLSYNFADLKLLHQIETLGNSRGLLALSSTADSTVLACPGLHTGQVSAKGGGTRWPHPGTKDIDKVCSCRLQQQDVASGSRGLHTPG